MQLRNPISVTTMPNIVNKCLHTDKGKKKNYFQNLEVIFSKSKNYENSVQFSHLVVSNSLWSHGLQHARLSCPSPTPRAFSNSCPSSWWCHPTILSAVVRFSSSLQSFPASGSFLMSQCFPSGCESFRWTAKRLSCTYTCIHFPPNSPSHPGCHETMNRVPCAIQ